MSNATLRNISKPLVKTIVLPSLCLLSFFVLPPRAKATEINFGAYAAVAYSPSTGNYGYGWNYLTRSRAEQEALSNCTGDDARIVGWVKGGWLVLVVGENNGWGVGWQYGDGAANTDALKRAVDECQSRGEKIREIVQICSGNIDPVIKKYNPRSG